MNKLFVKDINKKNNRIEIEYDITGEWTKYFNINEKFFIEYSFNIEKVPDSICVIPFLANLIPIVWYCNATIYIKELDKNFYNCLENVKNGYKKMMPVINFKGNVKVEKIIENSYANQGKSIAFFSGGLDSFSTLIGHIKEKPQLITVWGSDIMLDDIEGWNNVKNHIEIVSNDFKVKSNFIKTNFRTFINEPELTNEVYSKINDSWWHAFQHGIGIICQAAPIIYANKINKLYFAASYSEKNKATTCASDPTIDNYVKIANCDVTHDQYNMTRMDKVNNIVEYANKTGIFSKLRVCWISKGGKNCCKCEKCYRTIYELIACGANPNEYGFEFNSKVNKEAKNYFIYKTFLDPILVSFWQEIKESFINQKEKYKNSVYKWIYRLEPKKGNNIFLKKSLKFVKRIVRKITKG